jgi:hypothetical protein
MDLSRNPDKGVDEAVGLMRHIAADMPLFNSGALILEMAAQWILNPDITTRPAWCPTHIPEKGIERWELVDPKANLAEQVELANKIIALEGMADQKFADDLRFEYAERLAELVLAMDEWRRKGGADGPIHG